MPDRFPDLLMDRESLSQWLEANPGQTLEAIGAEAAGANLSGLNLKGVVFREADLTGAQFDGSDLRGAIFQDAQLVGARFSGADIRHTDFSNADLTETVWHGARINGKTRFEGTVWHDEHDPRVDGGQTVRMRPTKRPFTWEAIRKVGRLPLFAGSYLLLTGALAITTTIGWFNQEQIFPESVQPPPRLFWLLIGSTLLAIGSTLYEVACPDRIKEFTFTQWVEDLGRPPIIFVSDSMQRPFIAAFTALVGGPGAAILTWLFVDRLIEGVRMSFEFLG